MTENATTRPIAETVDGYFAMWNETDPVRRRDGLAVTWATEATYVDPMFDVDSHDGLVEMVNAFYGQFPGHRFEQVGEVDTHHDRARWAWALLGPDGSPVIHGVDYAVVAADGRLREVTGFLESPAA